MMNDDNLDETTEREALERQRASLLRQLPAVLEAIGRKGAAASSLARSAIGVTDASETAPSSPLRVAVVGAVAGGAMVAFGAWMFGRRKARRRLDRRVGRAVARLLDPPRASPLAAVAAAAANAAFDLVTMLVREAVAQRLQEPPTPRATPSIPPLPPRAVAARPSVTLGAAAPPAPPFVGAAAPPAPIAPAPLGPLPFAPPVARIEP